MSKFWRNWLNIWCAGVALFGAVLAAGAFEATSGPARALFALLMDGPDDISPQYLGVDAQMRLALDPHLSFTLGVLGAVTIGWASSLCVIIQSALMLERHDAAAAEKVGTLTIAGILAWFVIDSALSVATGFGRNAISNAIFLAAFFAPLIASGVIGGGGRVAAPPHRG